MSREAESEVMERALNDWRCDWCGRFYSSPGPEGSACRDHIPEHNARLAADIARFNARLAAQPQTEEQS